MATYATQADYEAYVEGWVTTDPAALERLLKRAERDIDYLLGPGTPLASGLRLDPATLQAYERVALMRATCAQAEWRHTVTEPVLAGSPPKPELKAIKGPDFTKEYAVSASRPPAPARFGPKVRQELAAISHLRNLSGRATA